MGARRCSPWSVMRTYVWHSVWVLLRVSRSSFNAADDVESHEKTVEVDPRRTVVAVIDEVVRRDCYLPRTGLGDRWTARDGRGGRELAVFVQSGSGWEPVRALVPPETEVLIVTDILFFVHGPNRPPSAQS